MTWVVLTVAAVGLVWGWRSSSPRRRTILGIIAAGGLWFQAFHMVEHLVQAVVWVPARDRPPFLTPLAERGADTLEIAGRAGSGAELLHLAGNAVFLAGLLALAGLVRPRRGGLKAALVVQGVHMLEHVALTLSVIVAGHAVGVTTLFGTLEPGPTLWSLRVLAHLGLNTTATFFAAKAVIQIATRPNEPVGARIGTVQQPPVVQTSPGVTAVEGFDPASPLDTVPVGKGRVSVSALREHRRRQLEARMHAGPAWQETFTD